MSCLCPLSLVNPETALVRRVACGQCRGCRVRRKQAWVGRLRLEASCHKSSRFLTLTYAEDPGVLDVLDLSRFMKRYRHHYGQCRFFAVGEYGEKSGRGHWHLIIFGHPAEVVGHWKENKAWDYGFSYDGNCTLRSIGYVGGYVVKAIGAPRGYQPICRQSLRPGIGFSRIEDMARASPKDLDTWPSAYRIGDRTYPLSQGGLAHFQSKYLELGGSPPAITDPDIQHIIAMAELADLGPRVQESRTARINSIREVQDVWAAPKARNRA